MHYLQSKFTAFKLTVCFLGGMVLKGFQAPLGTVISVPPTAAHYSVSGEVDWWDRLALEGKEAV